MQMIMTKLHKINNIIVAIFLLASNVNNGLAQFNLGSEEKIENSNEEQEATTPPAVSSRFLDLGGVISQLFSGFNQGSGGGRGGPGLNWPPNSQFYPSVPAQNGNPQTGQGPNWSFPNQGNNQNGNSQNQYQWNAPNQYGVKSNNMQPTQNQGWQSFGPNMNNQNNNQYVPQGPQNQGSQVAGMGTPAPWYPSQGNQNNGPGNSVATNNEGTLDDFSTESTPYLGGQVGGPASMPSVESTSKTAIWGKQVIVPDSPTSDNIVFRDSDETPFQKECVQNCPTSSEYSPVCGSDGVTYFNPGRLICARNCGINVFESRKGECKARG